MLVLGVVPHAAPAAFVLPVHPAADDLRIHAVVAGLMKKDEYSAGRISTDHEQIMYVIENKNKTTILI